MVKKDKKAINANRKKAAAKKPVVSTAIVSKPAKASGSFDKVYKTQKKSSWQKFVEYLKKRPVLMVLIPLLILGAGFVAYNQYQIYQEQQDFKQAEAVLDDLSSAISAELGSPIQSEEDKRCGYSSEKFAKGDLSCGVGIKLSYDPDTNEATRYNQYVAVINKMKSYSNDNKYYSDGNIYRYSINNSLGMNCSLTMELTKLTSEISLGCSKKSLSEHFPVVE